VVRPERLSAMAIAVAIFLGAGITAFNIGRYDAQSRTTCRALKPLTIPVKGTLP
jgi:hypothetical protein